MCLFYLIKRIKHMKEAEISWENPETRGEKKGMNAQELLDELKKWKESGIKKVQLIFEFGPSEEPVNLECMDLNKAEIKGKEILTCKAKITDKTTVGVNFDASTVIGIKKWIASGQADDVRWNRKTEKAKKNGTIDDEKFTENTGKGTGANDVELNKKLWEANQDNVAS